RKTPLAGGHSPDPATTRPLRDGVKTRERNVSSRPPALAVTTTCVCARY
ncbi:unnamed protein product, partial [Arctia plantaginis]